MEKIVFKSFQKNFFIKKYKIVCKLLNTVNLPSFLGKFLRGSFGINLKRVTCLNNKEKNCYECDFKNICLYYITFESIDEKNLNKNLKKGKYLPHPFVLEPPKIEKNTFEKGEYFNFNLILIGFVNYQINFFIKTLILMGEYGIGLNKGEGQFNIEKILTNDLNVIYPNGDAFNFLKNDLINEELIENEINEIDIRFLTNTRILNSGKLVGTKKALEFNILFKSIYDRIKTLAFLYNNWEIDFDEKLYLNIADSIKIKENKIFWGPDWNIYSGRQKDIIRLGGIMGNIVYYGNLEKFIPFLIVSKYTHVGEKTSYGFGEIDFSVII